jgi:hypothetical protein
MLSPWSDGSPGQSTDDLSSSAPPAADITGMNLPSSPAAAASPTTPAAARRWIGVGSSASADPRTAGTEAARQALTGTDAKLLLVFCSIHRDPTAVLAAINEVSGGVPLIGCSSGGEIATHGPGTERVVVTAFGGPGFTVSTRAAVGATAQPRETGAAAAECAAGIVDDPNPALLLLTDGVAQNQEAIVAGAYSVLGAGVPLIGGAACPDPSLADFAEFRTYQLHNDQVLTDAVVGAAISSDGPFGIAVRHGFRKVGDGMIVTRSADGKVYTLDDKPALPAYLDRLGAPESAYDDLTALSQFARTRPLGVRRRSGEEVRHVGANSSFADGSLGSSGEIPEGGVLWPMEGDAGSMLESTDDALSASVAALGGQPPIGFLAFDCVLRCDVLGEQLPDEVARMAKHAGDAPLAGFYTWGEICRTRGSNGFHHQSLAVLAVG